MSWIDDNADEGCFGNPRNKFFQNSQKNFPLRKKISYLCHYFAASNNRKLFFEKYWAVAVVKSYFEIRLISAPSEARLLFAPVALPF